MSVVIDRLDARRGDGLDTEVVERKGFAHPDTLCDALAEELSLALCRTYVGRAAAAFGGGKIDVEDLVVGSTRNWFRAHLPTLDADRDIVVRNRVRPGSVDLVSLASAMAGAWN